MQSRTLDRVGLIIHDRATHWQQAFPAKTKSADETAMAFQRFMGPGVKAKYVYTDGSKEFEKAARDLQWLHDTSNAYRPETNGVAERALLTMAG